MMLTRKLRILTTSMLEKEEIMRNLKNLGQGSISLQNGLDMNFLRVKNKPRKSLQAGCSGETHVS
nr:unnamed protein product [Callosobruchus chinensis]